MSSLGTPRALSQLGALSDVPGIGVGHAHRISRSWRTGTTVVAVPAGAAAAVDVRGGGPGTRETDALRPDRLVERIHAICLTGGSAFGLSAADGVAAELEGRGLGVAVGDGHVVPVVPAAVIFDLGRGGVWTNRPDADFGRLAVRRALRAAVRSTRNASTANHEPIGRIGAGTGAISGGFQGGIGTASQRSDDGVVAALMVVNSAGSVIDPMTALPWEADRLLLGRITASERRAVQDRIAAYAAERAARDVLNSATDPASLNTTIGVVAVSAALSRTQCSVVATVAHDGLARAIRPAHTMVDGDTIFALSTGADPEPVGDLTPLLTAAADCVSLACIRAVLAATSHNGGNIPAYQDLAPSVLGR